MARIKNKEMWQEVVVAEKIHPWYLVSNHGNIISRLTSKDKQMKLDYHNGRTSYKLYFPIDFFVGTSHDGYDYAIHGKNKDKVRKNVYIHQLVMHTFKPLELFPPDELKDCWHMIPNPAKNWIKNTITINHIDHNPFNNHISNLEYVTQMQNSRKAIEFYGGKFANKNTNENLNNSIHTLESFIYG